jgi:hypothetical protein
MSIIYAIYYSLFQKATVPFLTAYENINKIYFSDDITLSSFTSVVYTTTFIHKDVEFYSILSLGSAEKVERAQRVRYSMYLIELAKTFLGLMIAQTTWKKSEPLMSTF